MRTGRPGSPGSRRSGGYSTSTSTATRGGGSSCCSPVSWPRSSPLPSRSPRVGAGARGRGRWLRGPLGLAWRLQRGSLVAWTLGFAALGGILGGIAEGGVEVIRDNPKLEVVVQRLGGSSGIADTYFAAIMSLLGLVAAGYAMGAALRLRGEETSGHVEPVLVSPVSRVRWASSHLTFAVIGPVVLLGAAGIAAGLAYGLSTGDVGRELGRVL